MLLVGVFNHPAQVIEDVRVRLHDVVPHRLLDALAAAVTFTHEHKDGLLIESTVVGADLDLLFIPQHKLFTSIDIVANIDNACLEEDYFVHFL